jgi:hypothetical protein
LLVVAVVAAILLVAVVAVDLEHLLLNLLRRQVIL